MINQTEMSGLFFPVRYLHMIAELAQMEISTSNLIVIKYS